MNADDTNKDSFAFAPDADESLECEFNTQELKNLARSGLSLVHDTGSAVPGYDPYNTGAHRAIAFRARTGPTTLKPTIIK